jgi:hypothetical protein
MEAMPKIIYIMGTGRSGTTILDMMISNNPNILGAGEVTHMIDQDILSSEICSCGSRVTQCNAWRGVCEEFPPGDLHEAKSLVRNLEAHSSFFTVALNLIGKKNLARYRDINERLFRSLCGGLAEIVVDSSKYAGRALLLSRLFPENIQVICLTRSAEGIISAFRKKDMEQTSKSMSAIFLYYMYTLACFFICRIMLKGKVIVIQYEKMVEDPVATISQIEKKSTLSLAQSKRILENNDFLDVGHIVVGNRLRKQGKVKFRKSKHKQTLHGVDRLIAAVMNRSRSLLRF